VQGARSITLKRGCNMISHDSLRHIRRKSYVRGSWCGTFVMAIASLAADLFPVKQVASMFAALDAA
jgi:hypothetical protein